VWHCESTHDASLFEILDILGRDRCEGFDFDPFGEVIYIDQEEFGLPLAWGEGTNDVHSPDGERPWRYHTMECFGLKMGKRVELQAFGAFLHIVCTVALDGWPVIFESEYFGGYCSPSRVVSKRSFMDFSDDIVCLLFGDAF